MNACHKESQAMLPKLRLFSKISAIAVILVGGIVLLGWIFHIPILIGVVPGMPTMKVNTAVCFILAGISLWLWHTLHEISSLTLKKRLKIGAIAIAFLILIISLMTLVQYVFHINLGIDGLLMQQPEPPGSRSIPGRMAPNTASAFFNIGAALLILNTHSSKNILKYQLFQIFGGMAWSLAYLGLIGYLYQMFFLYATGIHKEMGMAVHTALCILLISSGILCTYPNKGIIGLIASESLGSQVARRLLPFAIVISPLIGALCVTGYRFSFYTKETETVLFSVLNTIVLSGIILGNTLALNKTDSRRLQAETALLQAARAADRASRAKSDFLANMSHELRTPLNAILGYSQIMNRDKSLSAQQKEFLAVINRAGEHLLDLINDVLDMSKIEAGQMSFNPNSFDLHQLLDNLEEMLQLQAHYKSLQLSFERVSNLPQYVQTDEKKLRQVLINLLGNALKFTHQGHVMLRICLQTEKKPLQSPIPTRQSPIANPQSLIFEVEDTGIGIAPEELETVFDAFVQTQSGRKAHQGTGLGLAISRQLVRLMGGDITVRSIIERGTIFRFDIPITLAEVRDVQSKQPIYKGRVLSLAPDQPEYRILIVEDRRTNRQLLVQLLEPLGFQVREAENGKEGVALWESWEPHLIWMDIRMPVMDGYEATKQIKAHPKGRSTTIIALTASVFEEERPAILAAGCDDFVRKPFREEVILEKIAQYLGVRYVYNESSLSSDAIARQAEDGKIYLLTAESLNTMPADWIAQLYQAALLLDDKKIFQLIERIPQSNTSLVRALTQKVNNFDFDQIINLTQQAK